MQQGVATSHTTIGALCNADLSMVERCATIPLTPKGQMVFFKFWLGSHGMSLQPIFFDIFRIDSIL